MPLTCIKKTSEESIQEDVHFCLNNLLKTDLIRNVEKVLIKPNFVVGSEASSGATTDLRVIKGLIDFFYTKGKEVFIGESSLENTEKVFETLGIYKLENFGAKIVNFDDTELIRVESPTKLALKHFYIPKIVYECDLVVSAAKMKAHDQTKVSLSVKNFLGATTKKDRKAAHMLDIDKSIVDVFAYFAKNKKVISFIDGIYAMEGKGSPTHGKAIKMDLLLAGDDAVATDSVCASIMGLNPTTIRHLAIANKLNLGSFESEIVGEEIQGIRRNFDIPPTLSSSKIFYSIVNKFFKRTSCFKNKEKCTLCGLCIENCPIENIAIVNNEIVINRKKCIGCMICVESCKNGAIDYEIRFENLYNFLRSFRDQYSKLVRR